MFKKNFGFGKHMDNCCRPEQNCPIMEPVINNCIEREFCHEVNHVCPIHTHIINKHIYNHITLILLNILALKKIK